MKRMVLILVILALAGLLGPPAHAKGWPGPVEAFTQALEKGDTATALAAFSAEATVSLPVELLPPDSRLATGMRAPGATLTLAGQEQIGAWLAEFATRDHGRIVIQGAAEVNDQGMASPALIGDDNLRALAIYWVQGTLQLSVQGERLTAFTVTLPAATLRELRADNPRIYTLPQPGRVTPRHVFAY